MWLFHAVQCPNGVLQTCLGGLILAFFISINVNSIVLIYK